MRDADFIIVGSGPAGVSAALPLVEAGRSVLMLDGAQSDGPSPGSQAERALGGALEALLVEDGLSPKLRTPEARRALEGFGRANGVEGDGFVTVGALARGGLSRVWGAFAAEFDADDLGGWPISPSDLAPSYARVARRIGVSGSNQDATGPKLGQSSPLQSPLPIGAAARRLLQRYRAGGSGQGLLLGQARNAILSQAQDGRGACDLRGACLWGCPIGAIYDARQDLAILKQHAGFRLVDGACVTGLVQEEGEWRLQTSDGRTFRAPRILLAAGTLGSTRLVAPLLPAMGSWPLLSNPVVAAPLLLPAGLMTRPAASHSLAQLAYFLKFGEGAADYVSGAIYETAALPASSFANQLPLGRRAGEAAFRFMAPGLLVAVTYFPGAYSRNSLHFDAAAGKLTVKGGYDEALPLLEKSLSRRLRKTWRGLGAYALPGARLATPGTDAHFAGTLPMGGRGPNGTNTLGELAESRGLHVVDGAVLPSLASKHATLTIMANADRIGRALAANNPQM